MFTASAVNGITSGKIRTTRLAILARCLVANSNQLTGVARLYVSTVLLMQRSTQQSSAAEEALRPHDQDHRHQGKDRYFGHFRRKQRRHADDNADQEPRQHGAADRA